MLKEDCIFCKIANKKIPAKFIIENDFIVAFNDLNPQAPTHILVITKEHYENLDDLNDPEILAKLLEGVKEAAKKAGIKGGYRTVLNTGKQAGQEVFHIHAHILGGRDLLWPPG